MGSSHHHGDEGPIITKSIGGTGRTAGVAVKGIRCFVMLAAFVITMLGAQMASLGSILSKGGAHRLELPLAASNHLSR